jgi:hypothetical protein
MGARRLLLWEGLGLVIDPQRKIRIKRDRGLIKKDGIAQRGSTRPQDPPPEQKHGIRRNQPQADDRARHHAGFRLKESASVGDVEQTHFGTLMEPGAFQTRNRRRGRLGQSSAVFPCPFPRAIQHDILGFRHDFDLSARIDLVESRARQRAQGLPPARKIGKFRMNISFDKPLRRRDSAGKILQDPL